MTKPDYAVLLREYEPLIQRVLRAYEADPSAREELAQDVALALWRALPSFRGEAGMKTFVARIAQNVAVSNIRRRLRAPRVEPLCDTLRDDGPTAHLERRSAYEQLLNAVQRLPLIYRQVVALALEDFSMKEVAEALEISEGAAAVRLTRARGLLSQMMRNE